MRGSLLALAVLLGGTALAQETYEIGAGDVLHVVVLGQSEMSGDFPVDREGMLSFPFLGRVKASDLSLKDLERKLTTLLADGYVKRPQVSITFKESRRQKVFVTGEVKKPGAYSLKADRSLRTLLTEVGELTADVGHEVIVVRVPKEPPSPPPAVPEGENREASPEPTPTPAPSPTPIPTPPPEVLALPGYLPGSEVFHVSLRELQSGNPDKDFPVEPGDTIFLPKAAQVYVTGYVARPGAFRFEEGMTVYKALALAGGVTDRGSSRAKIVRIVEGKKKEFKAKPTDVLQPEDTIVVPERFF